jgi:hypothetical protein
MDPRKICLHNSGSSINKQMIYFSPAELFLTPGAVLAKIQPICILKAAMGVPGMSRAGIKNHLTLSK